MRRLAATPVVMLAILAVCTSPADAKPNTGRCESGYIKGFETRLIPGKHRRVPVCVKRKESPKIAVVAPVAQPAPELTFDPVALAQARATQYWGSTPCGGNVTITAAYATAAQEAEWAAFYGPTVSVSVPLSWSTWSSPAGPNNKSDPDSTYTNCVATIDGSWLALESERYGGLPFEAVERLDFPVLCEAITHEYGNLFGLPETTAGPPSVMSVTEAIIPTQCSTPPH